MMVMIVALGGVGSRCADGRRASTAGHTGRSRSEGLHRDVGETSGCQLALAIKSCD